MSDMMRAFSDWMAVAPERDSEDFQRYAQSIAHARYVIRRVFRIVDEQARERDLDPLEHQALIQIYGFESGSPSVSNVAERLDIAPAFASRLVKGLEQRALVRRVPLKSDRRVTVAEITAAGVAMLREIDSAVHLHVTYFQSQLAPRDRMDALMIFAFYVGLESNSAIADAIREQIGTNSEGPAKPAAPADDHKVAHGDSRASSARTARKTKRNL